MNWVEELRTAIKTNEELEAFLGCKIPKTPFSIFLPRNFAKKIKDMGPNSSLWKQFIPQVEENSPEGLIDPIGDQEFLKAPQLIHRYKNRALFLPTTICPVICRYCFRKNELSTQDLFLPRFKETLDYLLNNPQIEELIFSGGDPFILSDEKISFYLEEFKKISSLKFIRFHTRTPIILPSRITPNLAKTLNDYSSMKITIAIHVNHFEELDHEVEDAISKLKGINLISQTVLLKDVNDDPKILKELIHHLISLDIRPYYLHHPDKVKGGMNYYLDINRGREIYHSLRDEVPGWALFNYVVDLPGGKGKTPAFNPETFAFSGNLLGKDGNLYQY
jgi:lysine 2,3-aminomutase